jgi:hypothetical protein
MPWRSRHALRPNRCALNDACDSATIVTPICLSAFDGSTSLLPIRLSFAPCSNVARVMA